MARRNSKRRNARGGDAEGTDVPESSSSTNSSSNFTGGGVSAKKAEQELEDMKYKEKLDKYIDSISDLVKITLKEPTHKFDMSGIPIPQSADEVKNTMLAFNKGIANISYFATDGGGILSFDTLDGPVTKKVCNPNAKRPYILVDLIMIDADGNSHNTKILIKKANMYVIGVTSGSTWCHILETDHLGNEIVNLIAPMNRKLEYVNISISYKEKEETNCGGDLLETVAYFISNKLLNGIGNPQVHFERLCWWLSEDARFIPIHRENLKCLLASNWREKVVKETRKYVTVWSKSTICFRTKGTSCLDILVKKGILKEWKETCFLGVLLAEEVVIEEE